MLKEAVFGSFSEFMTLVQAPFLAPEMLWIVFPLFIITLLMTFYFGKYIQERMSFDAAMGNAVVLIFVGIDLLRHLYHAEPSGFAFANPVLFVIILVIMLEGVLLAYEAFEHKLPKQLMEIIASPVGVNIQAYVAIAVVYLQTSPTGYTLVAAIVLFALLFLLLRCLQEVEHFVTGAHTKNL